MFCLLIGSVAFSSARRQKAVTASLFEQRKHGAQQKPRRRRDSDWEREQEQGDTIEFTQIVPEDGERAEETVPLMETSNNPLEVV